VCGACKEGKKGKKALYTIGDEGELSGSVEMLGS